MDRVTAKDAMIMNLEQAAQACGMVESLTHAGTVFTAQVERLKQSDSLNDYEFIKLLSDVCDKLEDIKFPNN